MVILVGLLYSTGIPYSSLLDLIQKVRSWISWGTGDLTSCSGDFKMANNIGRICCDCLMNLAKSCIRYQCEKCGRMLCENCVQANGSFGVVASGDSKSNAEAGFDMKSCKFCSDIRNRNKHGRRYSEKIHPSDSPRQSPEPPSPSSCGKRFSERLDGCSLPSAARGSVTSCTSNPSSVLDDHSPSRYVVITSWNISQLQIFRFIIHV